MSSSDEAPEESTFSESRLAQRLKDKQQSRAAANERRELRQKRRERDSRLKEQQSTRKKLLSEILQEEGDDEDASGEESSAGSSVDTEIPSQRQLAAKRNRLPLKPLKKTFAVKDGFTVHIGEPSRVAKASRKLRLPPAGTGAVNRREQFLFRESVPRR